MLNQLVPWSWTASTTSCSMNGDIYPPPMSMSHYLCVQSFLNTNQVSPSNVKRLLGCYISAQSRLLELSSTSACSILMQSPFLDLMYHTICDLHCVHVKGYVNLPCVSSSHLFMNLITADAQSPQPNTFFLCMKKMNDSFPGLPSGWSRSRLSQRC